MMSLMEATYSNLVQLFRHVMVLFLELGKGKTTSHEIKSELDYWGKKEGIDNITCFHVYSLSIRASRGGERSWGGVKILFPPQGSLIKKIITIIVKRIETYV